MKSKDAILRGPAVYVQQTGYVPLGVAHLFNVHHYIFSHTKPIRG